MANFWTIVGLIIIISILMGLLAVSNRKNRREARNFEKQKQAILDKKAEMETDAGIGIALGAAFILGGVVVVGAIGKTIRSLL